MVAATRMQDAGACLPFSGFSSCLTSAPKPALKPKVSYDASPQTTPEKMRLQRDATPHACSENSS